MTLLGVLEVTQDVLHGGTLRCPDADAQAGERLGPHLGDDRAQPVVAAGAAARLHAQLAEGQGHVVDHDEDVRQRGTFAGQDLAHGLAGRVHVRHRLHQDELIVTEPATRRGGRVTRPDAAGCADTIGQAIQHHPADVVAGLLVARAGIAQAHHDLLHDVLFDIRAC